MPRLKVSYKKRGVFHGNRYCKVSKPPIVSPDLSQENLTRPRPSSSTPSETDGEQTSQSSASRKLDFEAYKDFLPEGNGNCIFDIDILSEAIKSFVRCKECDSDNCIELRITDESKHGLAVLVELFCTVCKTKSVFKNSSLISTTPKKYDINLKFVCGMRSIGKGFAAGNTLCALLDLPAPPQRYGPYTQILKSAMEICAQNSMVEATKEAVAENDGSVDLTIALDGTWQKRGHRSLNGVISVTSVDTGKVLDVSIMSKYCQVCAVASNQNQLPEKHDCTRNYEGSSGGMEVAGALSVFENSKHKGVRYVNYLGDGDSKGFQEVIGKQPYGEDVVIKKLECIGHVQKRMGSRLRRLKKDMKKEKLSDGKVLGGKNRLTNAQMDKLQNYYGLAIRRAVSEKKDIQEMRRNIWATYFHKLSTDTNPQHGLCPTGSDSWCGYQKAKANGGTYKHKDSLPEPCLLAIKKIYRDLSTDDLLSKCLHGQTQNQNESFNNIIWSKVPKSTFVRLDTLTLGVYEAVLSFNDGHISKLRLYKQIGLKFSKYFIDSLNRMDVVRLKKAEKAANDMTKEARIARRAKRKLQQDQDSDKEDPDYGAGLF